MSSKTREAVEAVYESAKDGVLTIRESAFEKVLEALEEPIRNCDVGTAEEQIARFDAECHAIRKRNTVEPCAGCPCSRDGEGTDDCQLRWAQFPYEEVKNEKK